MRHDLTVGIDHEHRRDYLSDVYRGSVVTDQNIYDMSYGGLNLQLNAKNLFDTTYYPSRGGSTRVVVGDPLEVSLQASVRF
ncbi:hypothetical protein HZU72_01285 [Halomonas sp. QX-2]|jgi:outer membrane receptor protein involved in Fe transport|uniref:TonB-dependent receptor n=1 Tax=Vreelandella sedimenti TaxID=2729618 RepID=A0A7Z0SK80_9GAMM|nr:MULTISPECIES: hypothetical protein [Halomonas]NYT71062.1 hypothetical protein [Halomonas sedimenti]|tara:strand:+ start:112774 stop:113016 length:243 start_codon:yes stop_codon:yes gene_type:complete